MKKITATFIGANGSLGYITGKDYELVIKQSVRSTTLSIHRTDNFGGGQCEYSDTLLFLENWTNIKNVQ